MVEKFPVIRDYRCENEVLHTLQRLRNLRPIEQQLPAKTGSCVELLKTGFWNGWQRSRRADKYDVIQKLFGQPYEYDGIVPDYSYVRHCWSDVQEDRDDAETI